MKKLNLTNFILCFMLLLPNLLWLILSTKNNTLNDYMSFTILGFLSIILKIIIIFVLCFDGKKKSYYNFYSFCGLIIYYIFSILYIFIELNSFMIIFLAILPSFVLICHELKNKNLVAFLPTIIFTLVQLINVFALL